MRWKLCLSEFYFEIKYKKGLCDSKADALSSLTTDGGTVVEFLEN